MKQTQELYKGWKNVPENLKTKTQLKGMGLKPVDEAAYDAQIQTRFGSKTNIYNLYEIAKAIPVKQRIVDISEILITPKTIAEALYVINKSAKKSRDTKANSYSAGKHGIVRRSKNREKELYDLKNKAIQAAIKNGFASEIGYHTQISFKTEREKVILCDCCNDDDWDEYCFCLCHEERRHYEIIEKEVEVTNYLLLLKFDDYTFHVPTDFDHISHLLYLGGIERISAEVTRKVNITFSQAVELLKKFVENYPVQKSESAI